MRDSMTMHCVEKVQRLLHMLKCKIEFRFTNGGTNSKRIRQILGNVDSVNKLEAKHDGVQLRVSGSVIEINK